MRRIGLTILLGLMMLGCRQENSKNVPVDQSNHHRTTLVDRPTTDEQSSTDTVSKVETPNRTDPEPKSEPVLTNADEVRYDSFGIPLVFEYELPEVPEHLTGPTLKSADSL